MANKAKPKKTWYIPQNKGHNKVMEYHSLKKRPGRNILENKQALEKQPKTPAKQRSK